MNRKPTKNTRGPSAGEKRFVSWVKESNYCSACEQCAPVIAHHCEGATFKHLKTLVGHAFVIGLCQACDDVVTYGSRKVFRDQFGPQSILWVKLAEKYEKETGAVIPQLIRIAIRSWGR